MNGLKINSGHGATPFFCDAINLDNYYIRKVDSFGNQYEGPDGCARRRLAGYIADRLESME